MIAALGCWLLLLGAPVSTSTAAEPAHEPAAPPADEQPPNWWGRLNPLDIELHAFVSQGFIVTTKNNYLVESKDGSADFTEVGLNLTKSLTDELRAGMQLFAHHLGTLGIYSAKFDWFYLDYHPKDWFGIRAGRVKLPFGLYNDSADVDSARVPILLPQSVYPVSNRDFLLAQSGGEVYGYFNFEDAGGLEYRIYGGTIVVENVQNSSASPFTLSNVQAPYVAGGRLLWDTPISGLRIGASLQALKLDGVITYKPGPLAQAKAAGLVSPDFNGIVDLGIPAVLWVASAEWTIGNLLLAAEFSRWRVRAETMPEGVIPGRLQFAERFYGLAAYHLTSWLAPAAYASFFFPDTSNREGRANASYDYALAVRFDLMPFWLLKLEGHYERGTALLDPSLNGNVPLSLLGLSWCAFLAKTTLYW